MSSIVRARVLHTRWLVTCLLPREELTMTPPTRCGLGQFDSTSEVRAASLISPAMSRSIGAE